MNVAAKVSPPAIEVDRLHFCYYGQAPEAAALRDLSLRVEPGQRILVLGPNGAGKSTLVRVLAGLLKPTRGDVAILGEKPEKSRASLGVVMHATFLYAELTARENLQLFGGLYAGRTRGREDAALAAVGMLNHADEAAGRLSRGQQQRVTIARALLHDPPVILMDEPDTGLDPAGIAMLQALIENRPGAAVFTSHHVGSGLRLATHVALLSRGQLTGPPRPASELSIPELSELIRSMAEQPAPPT